MIATASLVSARLPECLVSLVFDYFGRSIDIWEMANQGQWENCRYMREYYEVMLHGACHGGHLAIVELAISRGARYWETGLAYACQGGHLAIAELMIANGAHHWHSAICNAYTGGSFEAVKLIAKRGDVPYHRGIANTLLSGNINGKLIHFLKQGGCSNCSLTIYDHLSLQWRNAHKF